MSGPVGKLLRKCAAELGLTLDDEALDKFEMFAGELVKWNRKINLTAITSHRDIVIKHFADSLSLMKVINGSGELLDIGSGGGFPSIPLKIALTGLSVVSVDAVEKKILFQRHAARVLQLQGFSAIHARCEQLGHQYAGRFDWIVSRAFSDLDVFVSMATPLLKDSGRIVAMKGKKGKEETVHAAGKLSEAGVAVDDIVELDLPFTHDLRTLVVVKKIPVKAAQ